MPVKTISPKELSQKIEHGEAPLLIDVREPAEHEAFNIGGKLIPLGNIQQMQFEEIENEKDSEIVVYCRSGMRSMQACLMLDAAGFRNVTNLNGGMLGWQEMQKNG